MPGTVNGSRIARDQAHALVRVERADIHHSWRSCEVQKMPSVRKKRWRVMPLFLLRRIETRRLRDGSARSGYARDQGVPSEPAEQNHTGAVPCATDAKNRFG